MSGSNTTTTSDALNFGTSTDGLAAGTITVSGNVSSAGITFGSASGNITLSGGNITLNGNIGSSAASAGITHTITSNISLSGDTRQFGNTANQRFIFTGVIGGASNLTADTQNGAGAITLNGTNTFTGNFLLGRGQVNFNSLANAGQNSALGAGSLITTGLGGGQSPVLWYTGASSASSNRTWNLQSATTTIIAQNGSLLLSGNFNAVTSGASSYIVLAGTADTGTNEISGAISNTPTGDNTIVTIFNSAPQGGSTEAGFWILSGNNSYNGTTTIQGASILRIAHANALGTTANGTSVITGSALELTGGISVGAEALSLSGEGISSGGGLRNISGNNSYAGVITLGNTARINSDANTLTLSGGITGTNNLTIGGAGNTIISGNITTSTGTLTKDGAGTLTFTGNNTYSGATTINAGTLSIGATGLLGGGSYAGAITNNATLIYSGTNNQTLSGNITGSGNLTKNASSTLTLSGVANNYNGTTTISGGTLTLSGSLTTNNSVSLSSNSTLNITGNLTKLTAGTFTLGQTTGQTDTVNVSGSGILNAGAGMTLGNTGSAVGTGILNITGGTVTTGGTIELSGNNSTLNVSGGSLNSGAAPVLDLGGRTGSSATLSINGTGSVTTAWLRLGQYGGAGTTGVINLGDGNLGGNLIVNNSLDIKNGATLTMNFNGGTLTTSQTWSLGGTLAVKSGGAIFNVTGNTLTISSNLTDGTGGGGLTKNGSGTLTLSGAGNTYTGTTTVNAGTLALGANQNLGAIAGAGALNLSTFTLTTNASSNTTYSGVISGSGNLTKNGTGTLTLSGNNTYNGTTTVNDGTISMTGLTNQLASASVAGTGNVALNGGSLTVNNSSSSSSLYLGNVTGSGNLNVTIGTYRMGGNITTTGTVSIATYGAGTDGLKVSLNDNGGITRSITANAITVTGQVGDRSAPGAGTLVFDTSAANGNIYLDIANGWHGTFYTNNITANAGTGNLTIAGTNGANSNSGQGWVRTNTLTGALNISTNFAAGSSGTAAGTWILTATGNSTISGNLALAASTTSIWTVNPGLTMTDSAIISGTGNLTKNGTGTLILGGANSYNGTTTVNAGTLSVTGTTSSSAITINSGGNLTGTGTVGAVTLNTGASIGAGTGTSTVGKLTGTSLTIGAGTGYAVTIGNVGASVAGTDYDQIALSGGLTLNNSAANPFTISLYGNATGWSNTGIYNWDIITASSLGSFQEDLFALDFTNFGIASGNRTGTWSFSNPTAGNIRLTYSGATGNSTWNTGTGSWNTAAQWSENAIPVDNNSLIFTGAGGTSTNNIGNSTLTAVNHITFSSGAGAYTLAASAGSAGASGGTALTVNGDIANNSSNLQTINMGLSLGSSTIVNAASGNIAIGGVVSGVGGILKSGANALTLSGANTYSGGTTLTAGTLNINNATALGNGTFTISGGTIDNTSGSAITLSNNNTQSWGGDFAFTGTNDLNLGTGNVTLGATPTITVSAGNLTVGGIISGSGRGLTKAGSGTMILTGNNTYNGTTTINAGTLQVGGSNGNIAGAIVNNANLVYTSSAFGIYGVTGTGNLTINQSSGNVYLQGNITQSGTVSITTSTATSTSGMIQSALGTQNTNRMNTSITASAITINGMIGAFQDNTRILTLDTSAANGAITLDLQNGSFGTWNPVSIVANAGTGNFTLSGSKAGTVAWTADNGNSFTGALNISSNFTSGNLTLNAAGNSSVTGNLNFQNGSNAPRLTAIVNSGVSMTISGNITQTSGHVAALTKNGTGTLILSGANNTYSGATTVNAGTLQLSGNISSSALTLNSGALISVGTNTTIAKYNTSSITIGAGSGYIFTIGSNASGTTAGTDFDQLTATGALTFNNTAASPFTVYVNGTPSNWSNTGNYTWNIMSGASISGFNSGNFVLNTSQFGIASGNRTGTWSFGTAGSNLTLSYTLATPDYFWDGGTGNWTDSYSAGVRGFTPSAPTADDNLYFTGAGGTVTNNMANSTISSVNFITFNSTAGAYTLAAASGAAGAAGGTALTVKGDIINNSATAQAISMALAFGGSSSGVINTAAGNITLSGNLSGAGTLTKSGNYALTLSGASKSNTGDVTINAGNVTVSGGALNTNITVNSGANLIAGSNYIISQSGSKILTINGGTLSITNTYQEPSGGIVLNNATINGNSSGAIAAQGIGWSATGNNTINHQVSLENAKTNSWIFNIQSGTTTINSNIITQVSRFIGLTKNGTGTLVLNGNNTAGTTSNATTLNAGTLVLNNNNAIGNTTFTINGGAIDNTSGSTITLTNNNTQSWNGDFAFLGTNGSLNMGTGAVTMNASRTVTVSNGTFTVGGAIGGATFGLTKNGSGTMILSGANTYNGTTTINAGTLSIGAADRIADTSNLNVAGGTFDLGGFNETLGSITGSGNITLGAGTLTTNSTSNTTFSGLISGTGGLTKNGTSTLTLSGNNSYNGTTTINAGTIEIAATGRLGAGNYTGNISNSGTLIHSGTNNQILGGILSGTGSLTQNAASTLTLSGANTYNGTTTIKSGTVVIGHATGLGSGGNISFTGGGLQYGSGITTDISSRIKNSTLAILVDTNGNNVTFASAVDSTNAGGFTKNGTGILTLGGNNTYAGNTRINTGTIEIGAAGRLGAGNYTGNIVNNGVLIYSGTSNQTLGGVISGTGALTHNASSTLTLAGNNTFNGATTINAGTLVLSGTNTASAITVASGATLMGTGRGGATTVSGTIAPGNSPGTLTVGSLTLNGGGVYTWEMADATGAAGTGWDRIASTGLLTVNSTSGSTFTIAITSSGAPSNWTGNSTQSWDIITYGSVSGFDATKFSINATAFAGSTANGSSWTLTDTGSALRLSYSILTDPIWAGGTGNWTTGFSPSITNGANATFTGAGGTATNDIVTGSLSSIDSITFDSTAGAYTLAADAGSSGYDAASALQLNGNIINNSTATQTINLALTSSASRVFDAASGNLVLGGPLAGVGGLTKNGSNKLTLSANNTYSGDTTINAGTVEITTTGLLGGGSYSGNIVNTGAFLIGSNSNQTLSGVISGTGGLTKNGTGTLTLAGNNNYSGNTTINTGTVVIGHANAAGTGNITQANGSSLLKIDTTGTITNNMSVYNVLATQSATLSGVIEVNNATWDIETGDTLTISGGISGNGGVTKNGNGTLVLSGNNTYASATTINAGTLNAASAGALGSNTTVQVNGGTLLVSANSSINGMNITLNGSSTTVPTLSFNSDYSGDIGTLTLSANSIIDMGNYNVAAAFADLAMGLYNTLRIYNWTGTTLWEGGTGADQDRIYFGGGNLTDSELNRISFYSGFDSGFLGTGFDLGIQSGFGNQIIPVPEPETWATGILLVLGGSVWLWRKRQKFTSEFTETTEKG